MTYNYRSPWFCITMDNSLWFILQRENVGHWPFKKVNSQNIKWSWNISTELICTFFFFFLEIGVLWRNISQPNKQKEVKTFFLISGKGALDFVWNIHVRLQFWKPVKYIALNFHCSVDTKHVSFEID
jgi:hypothetical protein